MTDVIWQHKIGGRKYRIEVIIEQCIALLTSSEALSSS